MNTAPAIETEAPPPEGVPRRWLCEPLWLNLPLAPTISRRARREMERRVLLERERRRVGRIRREREVRKLRRFRWPDKFFRRKKKRKRKARVRRYPRPRAFFNRARLTREEMNFGRAIVDDPRPPRARTRRDCQDRPMPCWQFSCEHHLGADVNDAGTLKVNFPGMPIDRLPATCSLAVADEGPQTLERVAELMNMSVERIRQMEASIRRKLAPQFHGRAESPPVLKRLKVWVG